MSTSYPTSRVVAEAEALLAALFHREPEREHICGNCRTPWGRSALPCKNDRDAS